jgi:hypothetical protein
MTFFRMTHFVKHRSGGFTAERFFTTREAAERAAEACEAREPFIEEIECEA